MKYKNYILLLVLFISFSNLQGQDFLISFTGSGGSTIVNTVKVENITQDTSLIISGSHLLHLLGVITGIEPVRGKTNGGIIFSPNPMTDYTRMQFTLSEPGKTKISIYDFSGKKIIRNEEFLSKGDHTYRIEGIGAGLYITTVNCGRNTFSGRLISSVHYGHSPKIVYENTNESVKDKNNDSKGANAETVMQYNSGDILKLTGIYGNYSTIKTIIPTQDTTIKFNFIACTDGDNNNYPVVEIGTQLWMAENLKTVKYINGDSIGTTTSDISGETAPKYQWAYDDNESNVADFGRLYTWYAVTDSIRKVCPTSWHIPADEEWKTLTSFLGIDTIAGAKLKETGVNRWQSPNTGATNVTGFTAVPDGYRRDTAVYASLHRSCYFWSSSPSQYNPEWAWGQGMYYNSSELLRGGHWKKYGVSVRCLKD